MAIRGVIPERWTRVRQRRPRARGSVAAWTVASAREGDLAVGQLLELLRQPRRRG